MSELPVDPEIVREEQAKELVKKVEAELSEWFEDALELVRSGGEQVSVTHFLELAGDNRTFAELSEAEKSAIRAFFSSPEMAEKLRENDIKIIDEQIDILLEPLVSEKQEGEPTRHLTLSNPYPCVECGNIVTIEADMAESKAGKWKKDKKTGKKYRDWDHGLVDCPHCTAQGKKVQVFVYYREWEK